MAYYLMQISYAPEAWAALVRNPHDRSQAIDGVIRNLGGKIERIWFSFGESDIVCVVEMPDNVAAAAFSMAISAGGACKTVKTTPLLTVQETINGMKKAGTCGYQPVTRTAG